LILNIRPNSTFVCTNKLEVELLEECGVRHTLISYAFADRVVDKKAKHGFAWIRDKFDTIFVDSGAHSAYTKGQEVDFVEYTDFLKKEREMIDVAAQLDIIGDRERTLENYIRHIDSGTDWVLPIFSGNWEEALVLMEPHLVTNYIGLGGSVYWKKFYNDGWNVVRNLPNKYDYHGFAKGNYEAFRRGWLYSIDSSSWSFGARGRETSARIKGANLGVKLGRKSNNDRNNLRYVHSLLKDDMEACDIDIEKVIEGDYRTLLKLAIVIYYRPLFREIGGGMFEKNFKW